MHVIKLSLSLLFVFVSTLCFSQVNAKAKNLTSVANSQQRQKIYLQTDRTFISINETVFFSAYVLNANTYKLTDSSKILYVEVFDAQNQVQKRLKFPITNGVSKGSIPFGNISGNYKIKVFTAWMLRNGNADIFTKEIAVQDVIYPNLLLKAELTKKSYIPGDTIITQCEVKELTQNPLANSKITIQLYLGGELYRETPYFLNKNGKADIKLILPKDKAYDNASINMVVRYKGSNESVSKTVPISMGNPDLQFLPEGGYYTAGIKSNIAFKSLDKYGKPMEVEGFIVDDTGGRILPFKSFHQGMGKFELTAEAGKTYFAQITKPFISAFPIKLPESNGPGMNLSIKKDANSVFLLINALQNQSITVLFRMRDSAYYTKTQELVAGENILEFSTTKLPMGIAQITVFDQLGIPLLERLVFVNKHRKINLEVKTKKTQYGPRDKVVLYVKATDENGNPAPGSYSLAVIDENQYTFANDKQGHILSQLYLSSELKGKVEEPDFYFDETKPSADEALDLLMLTQGWRRINWKEIEQYQKPVASKFKFEKLVYSGTVNKLDYSDTRTSVKNTWVKFKNTGQTMYVKEDGRFAFEVDNIIKDPLKFRINKIAYTEEFTFNHPPSISENDSLKGIFNTSPQPYKLKETPLVKKDFKKKVKEVSDEELKVAMLEKDRIVLPQREMAFAESRKDDLQLFYSGSNSKSLNSVATSYQWNFNDPNSPGLIYVNSGFNGNSAPYYAFQVNLDYSSINFSSYTEFYVPQYANSRESYTMTDKRSTIFWKTIELNNSNGLDTFSFYTGDEAKAFIAIAEGISNTGKVARGEGKFFTIRPLQCRIKMPSVMQQGDKAMIPMLIENNTDETSNVSVKIYMHAENTISGGEEAPGYSDTAWIPGKNFKNIVIPILVNITSAFINYRIVIDGERYRHVENFKVKVIPKGYPASLSYSSSSKKKNFTFSYANTIKNSATFNFVAHPTLLSDLISATTKMFRQPGGCFEQVSSSNYPNLVALKFLELSGYNQGNIKQTVQGYLQSGYSQLAKYETSLGGFEWFGHTPPHEGLTAYGLMQLTEMKGYVEVDEALLTRTKKWLLSRSNGHGSFNLDPGKYDQFRGAPEMISNAYITWALSEIGESNLDAYIQHVQKDLQTFDAYRAALLANTLINVGRVSEAELVMNDLLDHLKKGDFKTITAQTSITSSSGENLKIEVLALTAIALSKMQNNRMYSNDFSTLIFKILEKRGPYGFGSTQATILAYKALYAYLKTKNEKPGLGNIILTVNSKTFQTTFSESRMEPISFSIPESALVEGDNYVSVDISGSNFLPWEFSGDWMSLIPDSDSACKIKLATKFSTSQVKVGNIVQLNTSVRNTQKSALPQSIAILNIPAGLSLIPEQLKELSDKKVFDYYEIKDHTLVLYFLQMAPSETRKVSVNLKAELPGTYSSAAHSAYVYYANDLVDWQKGDEIEIIE
jgi:hypothetical protein